MSGLSVAGWFAFVLLTGFALGVLAQFYAEVLAELDELADGIIRAFEEID